MLEKLKSRKFLMALVSVIVGILSLYGVSDNTIAIVPSISLILVPAVVYIITEGKIDAASVAKLIETATEVMDVLDGDEVKKVETTIVVTEPIIVKDGE